MEGWNILIFVTLGSQKFQFNRILEEIDHLLDEKYIDEEVFAQIGYSDYKPKNYQYKQFLDREEFSKIMDKCDKVITHGGTGAIVNAVKKEKKVIAVPRLSKYGEHVDNHQIQIVNQFKSMELIEGISDVSKIKEALIKIDNISYRKYISNTEKIIKSLDEYLLLV